jgi:hypothetical protein
MSFSDLSPEKKLYDAIFSGPEPDLDKHTYDVIISKLKEAGWDNLPWEVKMMANGDDPVRWIEAELSHRVKEE